MKLRTKLGAAIVVISMLTLGVPLTGLMVAPAGAVSGGPVILDGMDPGYHGFLSGGAPAGPWIYIQKAYQNLMGLSSHGTAGQIAVIGATDSTAVSNNCGAGAHYAAAADGYTASYYGTPGDIDTFFSQLGAGTLSPVPRLIHIVDTACPNGLTAADAAVLVDHTVDIANFVTGGGALLVDTENGEFYGSGDLGYDWLAELLPAITITPDVGGSSPALTPAGQTAFPGLTDGDIQSPWHSGFAGSFGSLQVLATDGGVNVILGGSLVILTAGLVFPAPPAPPAGEVGAAYTDSLSAAGGTAPYSWSISAGALPNGLSINASTGVISGTPAANGSGTANFTVLVTDSASATASRALSISIAAPPSLALPVPPPGEVGAAYTDALAVTGGTGPFVWSITAGSLPNGLSINASTGLISGTPAADAIATAHFTVHVVDSFGVVATQALALFISASPFLSLPAPPAGEVGVVYTDALVATAGTGPFTWSISAGALPDGLSINPSTGVLSGTPLADGAGTAHFTVRATDSFGQSATQALTMVVAAAPALSIAAPPAGEVGAIYTDTLAADFGTGPFTWSISAGALPDGLVLDASTGVISGTPTVDGAGTANFTIHVTDSLGQTATQASSITTAPRPELSVPVPTAGEVGAVYTDTLAVTGDTGTAPFTWSISAGSLPNGLSLDSSTGVISGTPAADAAGTAHFTVHVTDGFAQTVTQALTLVVAPTPVLSMPAPPAGEVGAVYSHTLVVASGTGTGAFTWSVSAGSLPNGLSLNVNTGVVSGTPAVDAAGTAHFTVHVTDNFAKTATQALSLVITALPVLSVPVPPGGEVGAIYSDALTVTGGSGPFTWSVSAGSLPHGLVLNATTGVISGTPAADGAGTAHFTIHVTDSFAKSTTQALSIVIGTAPVLSLAAPPAGEVGVTYTETLAVTAGTGTGPFTWSISAGALPDGLSLDSSTGVISGTPAADGAGTAHFTVRVTDGFGQLAGQVLSLSIASTPSIARVTLPPAIPTMRYATSVVVAGGVAPYTWTLFKGALPRGLSVSASGPRPANTLISGIPKAGSAGVYRFKVSVTDANGRTAVVALNLTVLASQANSRFMASTPNGKGYWVAGADGTVAAFGNAKFLGSELGHALTSPIMGIQATPNGKGYWLDSSDGGVFAFGNAHFYGSTGGRRLNRSILGMASTPSGHGYWLVASDGGVFAFGDAHFYGSTGGRRLNKPIVGIAATADGRGYWLVASDGGVFAFGDAHFYGSTGGRRLNQQIVGMAATPDAHGYWLVASDGGIFAFGNARFHGSLGDHPLNQPITGMSGTPAGRGYWLVAADGGVFNFGDAVFNGSRA